MKVRKMTRVRGKLLFTTCLRSGRRLVVQHDITHQNQLHNKHDITHSSLIARGVIHPQHHQFTMSPVVSSINLAFVLLRDVRKFSILRASKIFEKYCCSGRLKFWIFTTNTSFVSITRHFFGKQ